ncbi:hypothetical protein ACLGL1_01665 [Peptococcus simiae]
MKLNKWSIKENRPHPVLLEDRMGAFLLARQQGEGLEEGAGQGVSR